MRLVDEGSTSPTLLGEVSNWENHPAWLAFRRRYDPLLRRWCRAYRLDEDSVDEVCQRIWIELADRMRTFRYDPNGSFRGWLRQVCVSRARDFLRQRKALGLLSLDDRDQEAGADVPENAIETDPAGEADDLFRLLRLEEAEKAQAAVRAKVKPQTWDAFWLVAVRDWKVEETARTLGMTHTAVYAARERVARMLCDEGKRVSDRWPVGP
ncbi:MAG: RNA polymerase sigma factor [Isosphaeraceae bacterium]